MLLKTPYLSFALQGADLVSGQFRFIKPKYRKNLGRALDSKIIPHMKVGSGGGATVEAQHLGHADFVNAVREPWMAAFNDRARNVKIWGDMGVFPFTKKPLYLKMDEEAAANAKTKKLSQKETKARASEELSKAVTGMFGGAAAAEKKKSGTRVFAGQVWKKYQGLATADKYMEAADEADAKKKAAEAGVEKVAQEKKEKNERASEARLKLCNDQWQRMAAAGFDKGAFPSARPKLLGLETMRAVLEHKYGQDNSALLKLKAEALQLKLFPHLELLRANAASADA